MVLTLTIFTFTNETSGSGLVLKENEAELVLDTSKWSWKGANCRLRFNDCLTKYIRFIFFLLPQGQSTSNGNKQRAPNFQRYSVLKLIPQKRPFHMDMDIAGPL